MKWHINAPDAQILPQLQHAINNKTKPPGALGKLEDTALQCGLIQQTLSPSIRQPHILVFAADHGIAATGLVNPYPQEVTAQMVQNFLSGGAAINVLCRTNNISLKVVNAGVKESFPFTDPAHLLINIPIDQGTKNYLEEPAMTPEQCTHALETGATLVEGLFSTGCNTIGLGEMGIGNSSSAALMMHALTGISLSECTGRGTGANDDFLEQKRKTLELVAEKHRLNTLKNHPLKVLEYTGGFELAMMTGAYCKAAELGMILLVDGFIATTAWLIAYRMYPSIKHYSIFTHCSAEKGHAQLLNEVGGIPLLHLDMRLGEGTGAAMAMPIIRASVDILNDMASFSSAGVSGKRD